MKTSFGDAMPDGRHVFWDSPRMSVRAFPLRVLAVIAISSCTLLLARAATAEAARTVVHPESFHFEARLPSSDGYSVFLRGYGHRRIELDLGSEAFDKPYTTMTYRTIGRVDRHGIEADFGPFGRVDMRFSGAPEREVFPFPNCKGAKPAVNQYGVLRGKVEFESLGGVVKLAAGRAEGETQHAPKRTCTPKPSHVTSGGPEIPDIRRPRPAQPEAFVHTFLARGHTLGRTIDLYAVRLDDLVVDVAATSTRRFGRVLVSTSVHAPEEGAGPGKPVELSIAGSGPRPRSAKLSAPAPFSGSATYRKRPGTAPTWLGSLAVEIPGEGTLPLAGPGFRAIICGYVSGRVQRACERTVASPHTVGR
jgi:hypothetical protein